MKRLILTAIMCGLLIGCDAQQWDHAVASAQDTVTAIQERQQAAQDALGELEAMYTARHADAMTRIDTLTASVAEWKALLAATESETEQAAIRDEIQALRDALADAESSDAVDADDWAAGAAEWEERLDQLGEVLATATGLLDMAEGKQSQSEQFDSLLGIAAAGCGVLGLGNVGTLIGYLRQKRVATTVVRAIDKSRTSTGEAPGVIAIDAAKFRRYQERAGVGEAVDRIRL